MTFSRHHRQQHKHPLSALLTALYGIMLVGSALYIASILALMYANTVLIIWTIATIRLPKAAVPAW